MGRQLLCLKTIFLYNRAFLTRVWKVIVSIANVYIPLLLSKSLSLIYFEPGRRQMYSRYNPVVRTLKIFQSTCSLCHSLGHKNKETGGGGGGGGGGEKF